MRACGIVALLLLASCKPHGRAAGASLELPRNAADQARRFQLPRSPTGDTDRDGVLDRDDACRREIEDYDGDVDLDGCPDDGIGLLRVDEETGELELAFGHELEFTEDEGVFGWRHEETLEQIAWFLRAHPRFTVVEITQYDDRDECDGFACDHEARWVGLFLVSHGVHEDRLHVEARRTPFAMDTDDDHVFGGQPTSRVQLTVRSADQ